MEILRILSRMTSSDEHDALDVLKQDHAAIADLFDSYETLEDQDDKQALLQHIIRVMTVHARIEEELFYPALRQAIGDQTVMDEADVEHAIIRGLMADLNRTPTDASHFDAKVRSLAQLVELHVEEEEGQMFQEARASNLNLVAIGGQLDAYRAALQSRYELDTDGQELEAFLSAPSVIGRTASPPQMPPPQMPRRPRRGAAASAATGNGERGPTSRGISLAGRRRTRRSSRQEAEASEGEPT